MAFGYVVANVNVTDPVQYEEYKKFSSIAMQKYGAEVLVRGGKTELMEGNLHSRVIILKFPSFDDAVTFHHSAEYQLAKSKRDGAAQMNMILAEGI